MIHSWIYALYTFKDADCGDCWEPQYYFSKKEYAEEYMKKWYPPFRDWKPSACIDEIELNDNLITN
jgi:hypothetical protein